MGFNSGFKGLNSVISVYCKHFSLESSEPLAGVSYRHKVCVTTKQQKLQG